MNGGKPRQAPSSGSPADAGASVERDITGDATIAADSSGPVAVGAEATAGTVLCDRWEIVGMLGAGGMGTVYRARDRELDEMVALKVLHGAIASAEALERFRREVKLARRVTHRNVARVHELREHEGKRFFTMELVDGESLRELVDRTGALALPRILEISTSIVRGLVAAHEVGVVHRDLKPDNVLIAKDGRVALTDFGIAASTEGEGDSTRTTSFVGTPLYMAPEQVDRRKPIDARTDLYAFGAVLYELLTGDPPFRGETPLAIAVARLTAPAPDPRARRASVPAPLADLVAACMAREPDDRPANAASVLTVLETMIAAGTTSSTSIAPISAGVPRSARTTPQTTGKTPTSLAWPALLAPGATRLAVLPVFNMGTEEDAIFAEGFTDDLIDNLSTVKKLHVLSRSVVARFGGRRDVDPREVGAALEVDVVAEGTLRRAPGGRLRVSLRLISAQDGLQLWSKRFDVTEAELLHVSDEAASAIATALDTEGPRAERKLSDPHAVELYLRARAAYRDFSLEGARKAVGLFTDALKYAPHDPHLLSGQAIALSRLNFFEGERREEALAAARRAIELAPTSGEAHLAMSAVCLQANRVQDSLRHSIDAVGFGPSLAEAHQMVGRMLAEVGPMEMSLRFLKTALELDPGNVMCTIEEARVLALSGRVEEGRAKIGAVQRASLQIGESRAMNVALARLASWRNDATGLAEAVASLQEEIAMTPLAIHVPVLQLFISAFDDAAPLPTEAQLDRLFAPPHTTIRRDLFLLQLMTEAASRRGELDRARSILRRAIDVGLYDIVWLERCSVLEPLRADGSIAAMVSIVAERAAQIRAPMRAQLAAHGGA
ncbi:MAG: protein kinase [Polyangiaceae bacterium]|nr:protein kinase [Polyangiaceae bacterium]